MSLFQKLFSTGFNQSNTTVTPTPFAPILIVTGESFWLGNCLQSLVANKSLKLLLRNPATFFFF